jgi:integrase
MKRHLPTSGAPDRPSTAPAAVVPYETIHQALVRLDARAQASVDEAKPANTLRAYSLETACFAAWATRHGLPAMPATARTIRAYMRDLADSGRSPEDMPKDRTQVRPPKEKLGYRSIMRALAAICYAHVRAGHPSLWRDPLIEEMRDTIANEKGVRPNKKEAIELDLLARVVRGIPEDLRGLRDRAMILCGWWGATRRAEVVGARVEHFRPGPEGMFWLIPKSKTDQHAAGAEIPLRDRGDRVCPVTALEAWLAESGIQEGFVFRGIDRYGHLLERGLTEGAVALRLKVHCKRAWLDPTVFAGHSLRSGFITEHRNEPLPSIMLVTRHRKAETVLGYIQTKNLFEQAAGKNTRLIK